jgi:hypothetical protein
MSNETKTPWLSRHRIAKPCSVKWSSMSGDEKTRFCGQCKLNVHNLSAMSTEEAEGLLARKNGKICTYFYRRTDGTILTQDCPVGLRQVYRKQGLLAAALYAVTLLASSCAGAVEQPLMGRRVPSTALLGGAPLMGDYAEPAIMGEAPISPEPPALPEPPAPALTPIEEGE